MCFILLSFNQSQPAAVRQTHGSHSVAAVRQRHGSQSVAAVKQRHGSQSVAAVRQRHGSQTFFPRRIRLDHISEDAYNSKVRIDFFRYRLCL